MTFQSQTTVPNTVLQSGYDANFDPWYTANFDYGSNSGCHDGISAGMTAMCDTDGHGTQWTYNGNGNVTQITDFTGTAERQWIATAQGWDATNDLISTTDANGNTTLYAYDSDLFWKYGSDAAAADARYYRRRHSDNAEATQLLLVRWQS